MIDGKEITEQALTKLLAYVEGTEKFVGEQVPQLVDEIIAWGVTHSVIWMIIGGVICLVLLLSIVGIIYGTIKRSDNIWEPSVVVGFICLLVGPAAVISNTIDYYKIQTAPRLYLLEEIPKVIRGVTE